MGNLAGFIEEEDEDMQIEEWWAQTFEGCGSVTLDQMPDNSIQVIRKLKTEEVLELVRSEDTRSVRGPGLFNASVKMSQIWAGWMA